MELTNEQWKADRAYNINEHALQRSETFAKTARIPNYKLRLKFFKNFSLFFKKTGRCKFFCVTAIPPIGETYPQIQWQNDS